MKKLVLSILFLVVGITVNAQLFVRNEPFYTMKGSLVFVNGDVEYAGDTSIEHSGIMEIKGDWYNASVTDNRVFNNSHGVVQMTGDFQTFNGNGITRFPTLILEGLDKKQLREHIQVDSLLDLTDRELDANGYTIYVLSAEADAIQFNDDSHGVGFVNTSTSKDGWLIRTTSPGTDYIYPLGYLGSKFRFRPLLLSPKEDGNIYAQFQHYDPAQDGYPVTQKNDLLAAINDLYYHNVRTDDFATNEVELKSYSYSSTDDGTYSTLAQWDRMKNMWSPLASLGQLASTYATNNLQFSGSNILLSNGMTVPVNLGTTSDSIKIHIPNVFTPDGDGINDNFVITGLDNYPDNDLVIFNRWNNVVYERKNYANNWNGSSLNEGTYFYVLKLKDQKGKIYVYRGFIMIMRSDK